MNQPRSTPMPWEQPTAPEYEPTPAPPTPPPVQRKVIVHQQQVAPSKTVIRQQGRISFTRIMVAFFTMGLSLPFLGVRTVRRTTSVTR